jgi:hypothetical protein
MTDQQTVLRAVSNAQRILEEYLEPRPHDNEHLLNRLVEVLDRNEVVTAPSAGCSTATLCSSAGEVATPAPRSDASTDAPLWLIRRRRVHGFLAAWRMVVWLC